MAENQQITDWKLTKPERDWKQYLIRVIQTAHPEIVYGQGYGRQWLTTRKLESPWRYQTENRIYIDIPEFVEMTENQALLFVKLWLSLTKKG